MFFAFNWKGQLNNDRKWHYHVAYQSTCTTHWPCLPNLDDILKSHWIVVVIAVSE